MFRFLRSGLLLALLALPLLTATVSCTKKDDTPAPTATTGSAEGTVSPVGAIATVTATNANGITFLATPNASTGAFAFANLAPGRYALSFAPASGYGTPAARAIDIVAGQTAAAGTVVVIGDGTPRGTLTWRVGGVRYTATAFSGRVSNQALDITAIATTGNVTDELTLSVPTFGGAAGAYNLGFYGPGVPGANYRQTVGGLPTLEYGTYNLTSTGILTVAAYDATARILSGTFGFVGQGYNATTGSTAVTNGTFSLQF